ncbi:MAG: hypothetical protein WKF90_16855, partial [Pyrinomonadaceae bacterium]
NNLIFMIKRIFTYSFLLIILAGEIFAQTPNATPKTYKKQTFTKAKINPESEKADFEKALKTSDASQRTKALQTFIENFPDSSEKIRASELLVSARAEAADGKLRLGETANGVELFKRAVTDAPKPISDKLFTEIILQIPTNLFFRGQTAAALEVARTIEEKAEGNAKQLLGLATYYLGTENASEATRIADKAIALEPTLPAAYQTLGLASRLNFQMEAAANAYAKALELDPNSTVSKRSLAEMLRSLEKPNEAIALYREILAKDAGDASAQTGLILALFDADKKAEAETEMAKSLENNANNLPLLVGASYWYAARGQGARAIELAEKAVAVEPRYTWAQIALGRGLLQEKRPLEAERALLSARQYGNFPTLDYEIAAARMSAGFYREAADELKKSFIFKDGVIETKLGGRVFSKGKGFIELLGPERRASIFQPLAADSADNAQKLKSLLEFFQNLDSPESNSAAITKSADEFMRGEDKMKLHRQIFVANQLLEKKIGLPKVLEITKSAVGAVDSSLEVTAPAAAVLADELYESRKIAMTRGELVIVPEISKQTLSSILRGRIEEISGWALFQEDKPAEAVVRLKRAVSVLPEKSVWWRSSLWKLGTALETDGKSKDALASYLKSYTNGDQSAAKRIVIESLYQKVNGNLEGLDAQIGANSAVANTVLPTQTDSTKTVAQTSFKQNSNIEPTLAPEVKTSEVKVAEALPTPAPESSPQINTETAPPPKVLAQQETILITKIESTLTLNTKTKLKSEPKIKEKLTETAAVPETVIKSTEPETNSANAKKPFFEPIIIIVPKTEQVNSLTETETRKEESNKKSEDQSSNVSKTRQRITADANTEINASTEQSPRCSIKVSQENVSLVNNGGSLEVLITFDGKGNFDELKAVSSSQNDVEVTLGTEISDSSSQAFFVIKSISANKGKYKVTFESGCGAKEILVTVR